MLFAAGLGTRLRPLTDRLPKPLVEIDGQPLMAYALERFAQYGVERVVVNTHHLAEQVERYLASQRFDFEVIRSHEPQLLETGGGLVRALPWLGDEPFFSANADTFWIDEGTPALERLASTFDPEKMDALLLLHPRAQAIGYRGPGNFELSPEGQLGRAPEPALVFTGLQLLSPRLLANQRERAFSLRELYDAAALPDGRLARMHGLIHHGAWLHVGSPEELAEANAFCAARSRPIKT